MVWIITFLLGPCNYILYYYKNLSQPGTLGSQLWGDLISLGYFGIGGVPRENWRHVGLGVIS